MSQLSYLAWSLSVAWIDLFLFYLFLTVLPDVPHLLATLVIQHSSCQLRLQLRLPLQQLTAYTTCSTLVLRSEVGQPQSALLLFLQARKPVQSRCPSLSHFISAWIIGEWSSLNTFLLQSTHQD